MAYESKISFESFSYAIELPYLVTILIKIWSYLLNIIPPFKSTFLLFQNLEIVAKNDTVKQNSSLDCGVDMMSFPMSQEAEDYMSTWGTCSFWMEGVLLTSVGKRIETL